MWLTVLYSSDLFSIPCMVRSAWIIVLFLVWHKCFRSVWHLAINLLLLFKIGIECFFPLTHRCFGTIASGELCSIKQGCAYFLNHLFEKLSKNYFVTVMMQFTIDSCQVIFVLVQQVWLSLASFLLHTAPAFACYFTSWWHKNFLLVNRSVFAKYAMVSICKYYMNCCALAVVTLRRIYLLCSQFQFFLPFALHAQWFDCLIASEM